MCEKKELPFIVKCTVPLLFFVSLFVVFYLIGLPSKACVKLTVFSSSSETLQVFWLEEGHGYAQDRSTAINLKPGEHEYSLKISPSSKITRLRLDPAVRPSTIALERFVMEWDGKPVFELAGEELKDEIIPVQEVVLRQDRQNGSVLINSTGIDPILELDAAKLAEPYRYITLVKKAGLALPFTMVFMVPLLYITSKLYVRDCHFTYPGRARHWFYWGVAFFILGMYLVIVTPVHFSQSNPVLHFAAISYVTGALLFVPAFWFTTRKLESTISRQPSRFAWFWFALPSLAVWLFYLLSFWPGSMSPDSLDQWKEILNGHWRDWHPAFHTMNVWLITRINLSPATVAITQIFALGSTAGWALSVLQRYGVPKTVLWLTSLLFALLPVNGLMVVTLWKDIPYSLVLLVLSLYLFQIVIQKGLWLAHPRNIFLLGVILALISLYRHNGVVPAFVATICLFCFYSKYWKGIFFAAMLALLIHAGVRGPLYNVLEVKRGNPMTRIQEKLRDDLLKKFAAKPIVDQQTKVVEKINDVQSKTDRTGGSERAHLSGLVWDRIYSASVLWRITTMDYFHKRIDYVNLWHKKKEDKVHIKYVSSNRFGITEKSVIPAGKEFLFSIFNTSRYNKYLFWMWRPAVYLYVLTGLLILSSWRFRKNLYLVLVPSLVNSLPVFLVVIHKSVFRYHYPIVVLGMLFIIPLLFLRPVQNDEHSEEISTNQKFPLLA